MDVGAGPPVMRIGVNADAGPNGSVASTLLWRRPRVMLVGLQAWRSVPERQRRCSSVATVVQGDQASGRWQRGAEGSSVAV